MIAKSVVIPDLQPWESQIALLRQASPDIFEDMSDDDVWLNGIAVKGDRDFAAISEAALQAMGATEEEVNDAIETFQPKA